MIDKLEHMIKMQRELQERTFTFDFARMSQVERIQYIRDQHQALIVEMNEVLDETEWKPWAKLQMPDHGPQIQRDAYVGELIDVIHFWLNMLFPVCSAMSASEIADEVFTRFALKNRTNAQRQVDGYDGKSTKCGGCGRALDDVAVRCTRKGDQGYCAEVDSDINYITDSVRGPIAILKPITPTESVICLHCEQKIDYYGCVPAAPDRWGHCAASACHLPPIKIATT